jgi:histidinol-phosphate/aromatic aminotransferase/cobyric acid decarboxylase-like protein
VTFVSQRLLFCSIAGMTTENQGTWDSTTQTFHGGQDWKFCPNFVEDFSVTTNGLGVPKRAMEAAIRACAKINHYPPSDFEPAISDLAKFLWVEQSAQHKSLLTLGNGASELIDLVIRQAKPGKWRPGPQRTQYKEYARSAGAAGFICTAANDRSATLLCIVNPTNPTGDYWDVETMKSYIDNSCERGSTVIVDESMQPWQGPHWRQDSLIAQRDWVKFMSEQAGIDVWIMTSWTKIWSCTGVRLGSVVAPTPELMKALKSKQVPWSVNIMALEFLSEACRDDDFMEETWKLTPAWNRDTRADFEKQHPEWDVFGKEFLSWVWIDTKDEKVCEQVIVRAKAAGVPVRSGAPGYNLPTFFRAAVRCADQRQVLMKALAPLAKKELAPSQSGSYGS